MGESVRVPSHPDVADALNNLAVLYVKKGRYADARRRFTSARFAIWEKAFAPKTS